MIKVTVARKGITVRKAKKFARIVKSGMLKAVKFWRDGIMPGHFKQGAPQKYRYEKRTPKYQHYKTRHGIGPLQFEGRAKRKIEADRRMPTGTNKKVTLRIKGVGAFHRRFQRPKSLMPPWRHTMADELTASTQKERNELLGIVDENVRRAMVVADDIEQKIYRPR